MLKRFVLTFLLLTPTITISGGLADKSKSFVENLGKEVVKTVAKNDIGLMPSSNYPGARDTSGYAPRIYNGLMPSSTYPGFSGSRVNLIE